MGCSCTGESRPHRISRTSYAHDGTVRVTADVGGAVLAPRSGSCPQGGSSSLVGINRTQLRHAGDGNPKARSIAGILVVKWDRPLHGPGGHYEPNDLHHLQARGTRLLVDERPRCTRSRRATLSGHGNDRHLDLRAFDTSRGKFRTGRRHSAQVRFRLDVHCPARERRRAEGDVDIPVPDEVDRPRLGAARAHSARVRTPRQRAGAAPSNRSPRVVAAS